MFGDFFRDLFNFRGVNWWVLLGGLGSNFIVFVIFGLGGAYLAMNEGTAAFYQTYGPVLMVLVIFVACVLTGWVTGKISDDYPVKHAFISSLGAVAPLLFMGVISLNPMMLVLAGVAAAGNLNGGMLSVRKRHYHGPDGRD